MKRFTFFMAVCMLTFPALAAGPGATGRVSAQNPVAAARKTAPAKIASMSVNLATPAPTESVSEKSSVRVEPDPVPEQPEKDRREKEKAACIQNNIGVGNTFVWASRYSNLNDYSTMIEDVDEPENNTCYVKVVLKSADSRIDLNDIPSKYFEMGRNITCGAWADADKIEKRILDAKKAGRTWATVGGAVGGAAIGVGSMELFGNALIGGAVQGQKAMSDDELMRSQLLVLKKENNPQYNEIISYLEELKKACDSWKSEYGEKPDECTKTKYDYLLGTKTASN